MGNIHFFTSAEFFLNKFEQNVNRLIFNVKRDNYELALKNKFYFKIVEMNKFNRKKQEKKLRENTDFLLLIYPFRKDYLPFFLPIMEQLSKEKKVKILIPSKRYKNMIGHISEDLNDSLFYSDEYCSINIKEIKKTFNMNKRILHSYCLEKGNPNFQNALELFYKRYLVEFYMFYDILISNQPKLIYSLHFIANPGVYAATLAFHKNTKQKVQIVLMQHGFFKENYFHDFQGADKVILWGNHHKEILKTYKDCPEHVVLGNVKLDYKLSSYNTKFNGNKTKKSILYISSGDPTLESNSIPLKRMIEIAQKQHIDLFVRMHPLNKKSQFKDFIKKGLLKKNQILSAHNDAYEEVRRYTFIVGKESTLLYEATVLGCFTIILANELGKESYKTNPSGIKVAFSAEEVETTLISAMQSKEFSEKYKKNQLEEIDYYFKNTHNVSQIVSCYLKEIVESE